MVISTKEIMKNITVITLTIGALVLSACGSKTDPNEKNFGAAMNQYFEKKGDLCLGTEKWPVVVTKMDEIIAKSFPKGGLSRMEALQAVGLVRGEDVDMETKAGAKFTVKNYSLTDAAKPFTHTKDVNRTGLDGTTTIQQTDICWGKKRLEKIVKWEGPIKLGDYQEAKLTYTYKINDVAPWANNPDIQAAFPGVKSTVDGAGKNEIKHGVKLTSEGWEARGLDSAF